MNSCKSRRGGTPDFAPEEEGSTTGDSFTGEAKEGLRSMDIMVERGRRAMLWPGNMRYVEVIQEFVPQYHVANSHSEKASVVRQVMNRLAENGARFVKKSGDEDSSNGSYEEVPEAIAKKKVGQTLRHYMRQQPPPSSRGAKVQLRKRRGGRSSKKPGRTHQAFRNTMSAKAGSRPPPSRRIVQGDSVPDTSTSSLSKKKHTQGEDIKTAGHHSQKNDQSCASEKEMINSSGAISFPGKLNTSLLRIISYTPSDGAKSDTGFHVDSMCEERHRETPSSISPVEQECKASLVDEQDATVLTAISRSIFEEVAPIEPLYPHTIPIEEISGSRNKRVDDVSSCFPMSCGEGAPLAVLSREGDPPKNNSTWNSFHLKKAQPETTSPSLLLGEVVDYRLSSSERTLQGHSLLSNASALPEVMDTDDQDSFDEAEFLRNIESAVGWDI